VIQSGAEAKALLRTEQVTVNGVCELRRGRKLTVDDVVCVGELELQLSAADADTRTG
jgi:ribosome-associated protein YbcJ (S4-like RNA binding protein)